MRAYFIGVCCGWMMNDGWMGVRKQIKPSIFSISVLKRGCLIT